ncbi:MAG: hypothetical protein QOI35_3032, partial [Cryptosporangiaceae bacterium]|nr:hypothetical protein [Cryptosporangiaceae bacterium]
LTSGSCGSYSGFTTLVTGATSPYSDTSVVAGNCYQYQYVPSDNVGNTTTATSASVTKVDTTAPAAPTLGYSAMTNTYASGNTVYYRSTASSGSFTATGSASDAQSGIASYAFGSAGAGWTSTPGSLGVNTYSWASGSPATTSPSVSTTNSAGLTSTSNPTITLTADSVVPSGGSVTYADGYTAGASVTITLVNGSDATSGLGTRLLQRQSAALSGAGTCGSYGSWSTIVTNPVSPYTDSTGGNLVCYKYQYVVADNVGNSVTYTSASTAKLDYATAVSNTTGLVSQWRLGETTTASDSFTDSTSTGLASHVGEVGTTWTKRMGSTTSPPVITDANRVRTNHTGEWVYYASATPASADYSVSADILVKSNIDDTIGVIGRLDSTDSSGTYYEAEYAGGSNTMWSIYKRVGGSYTSLGSYSQTLTVGHTYHLVLSMVGTSITASVDGVQRISATSSSISAAGKSGLLLGYSGSGASATNTTGYHLDNFSVDAAAAADSKGTNDGTYNGPTKGITGAIANDTNTAVGLDGATDNISVPDATSLDLTDGPLSLEAWVQRADNGTGTQTIMQKGTGAYQLAFKNNKIGLYKYGTATAIAQSTGTQLDTTAYHHYVVTKTGSTVHIYVDGVDVTSAGTGQTLVNTATALTIGGSSSEWLNGNLDEVAVYNTVLSSTTVANHYNLGMGADVFGPTGGSVDASSLTGTGSRYSTSTTLSVALAAGTDPSGLAASGAQLLRATATLTSGTCGTYGSYSQVGSNDPSTPVSDVVADQACYSYEYVVADTLGNSTTYGSADIKVDTTTPGAPSLAYSALTNAYPTGSTVYYKPSGTGSFTVTATATSGAGGIASATYPALGTGWTSTPGTVGVNTYSWTSTPTVPGAKTVTVTGNNGLTSSTTTFTTATDTTAPSGGSVSYAAGYTTGLAVSVTLVNGTDVGTGIGTMSLQRADATFAAGACGSYSSFVTVATNPASPYSDTTVGNSGCYKYQYVVADNVGNSSTYTSVNVATVDSANAVLNTAGLASFWRMGANATVADSFTDTAATTLQSHTSDNGGTWTNFRGGNTVVSNANRIRKASSGDSEYSLSTAPGSADYSVTADVTPLTTANDDWLCINGRFDISGSGSHYQACYGDNDGKWEIWKNISSSYTQLSTGYTQTLTAGQTYNLRLQMVGSTLTLWVDGVQRQTATDSNLTSAYRAGFELGTSGSSGAPTNTTGWQLDNFRVVPANSTTITDSKGTNTGTYSGSPIYNTFGAPANDLNGATHWTSSSSYGSVPDAASLDLTDGPFTLEAWVRRQDNGTGMQTIMQKGNGAFQFGFYNNKIGLFKYTGSGVGTIIAQSTGTQTDTTAFHHYVATKTGATVHIYVDGTDVTGTVTNQTLANTATALVLGGGSASEYLNGYLDEVAVYNQVLGSSTVSDHYHLGYGS